jgi:hypothetical protein
MCKRHPSCLGLILAVVLLVQGRPAYATQDIGDVELLGIKLGMTSTSALQVLSQRFGRANLSVTYIPCLRDALEALGKSEEDAPATCITEIRGADVGTNGESIRLELVEALADRNYGTSIVYLIQLYEPVNTDSDANAFKEQAVAHLNLGPGLQWGKPPSSNCRLALAKGEQPYHYQPFPVANGRGGVAWNATPYAYNDENAVYTAQVGIAYKGDGYIRLSAPDLMCRNATIYTQRITQPTTRYDF